jgi:large subunit ribosomal protein L23
VSTFHKDHRDVLIAPVVSEKSYGLLDVNKYTFLVHPDANKTQIKIAVEKVFNVKVTSVNTLNRPGKTRRTRSAWAVARAPSARSSASPRVSGSTSSEDRPEGRARTRTEQTWLSVSTSRPPRAVVARRWPTSSRSPGPRRRSR